MPGFFSWSDRHTFASVKIRTVVRGSHSATLSAVERTWLPTGLTRSDRSLRPMTTSRTVGAQARSPFPGSLLSGNADGCFGSKAASARISRTNRRLASPFALARPRSLPRRVRSAGPPEDAFDFSIRADDRVNDAYLRQGRGVVSLFQSRKPALVASGHGGYSLAPIQLR